MKKKEIRLRCWITVDGSKVFGPGPAELLALIQDTGSISKAAKKMKMSYKKAWDIIDTLNKSAQKPLVVAHKGGDKGGGAEITEHGKQLVAEYRILTRNLNTVLEKNNSILKLL